MRRVLLSLYSPVSLRSWPHSLVRVSIVGKQSQRTACLRAKGEWGVLSDQSRMYWIAKIAHTSLFARAWPPCPAPAAVSLVPKYSLLPSTRAPVCPCPLTRAEASPPDAPPPRLFSPNLLCPVPGLTASLTARRLTQDRGETNWATNVRRCV